MRKRIKVYKDGLAYLGTQVTEDGYKGEVDALFNAVTITLIKPKTSLEDVIRSLEITIEDIRLRMKQVDNNDGK